MLKVIFIRHGESLGNAERRMMGQLDDGLTAVGRSQCRLLGQFLCDRYPPPTHIYTSPLQRALESVVCLAKEWQWDITETKVYQARERLRAHPMPVLWVNEQATPLVGLVDALAECQAGILTGLSWAEAQDRYPDLCTALETSSEWIPIPAAETPQQGRDRAQRFIQYLHQQHVSGDIVWVISHQWILEHLIAVLLGCDRTWQLPMPNTALFEFDLAGDREPPVGMDAWIRDRWQIHYFGSRPHLDYLH